MKKCEKLEFVKIRGETEEWIGVIKPWNQSELR